MKKFKLSSINIDGNDISSLLKTIKSGWLAYGEQSKLIENVIKKKFKLKNVILCNSCTSGIYASLKALGVKKNTPVILPNYTCISNLSAVNQLGGKPIIVEVENDTLGLEYENVLAAIKKYKPKVLQIVHVYGFPARDTLKIIKLCKK